MKDDNKSYFDPCPKCGSTGFCECMAYGDPEGDFKPVYMDQGFPEQMKVPAIYIFFDTKWKLYDGELPVKPDYMSEIQKYDYEHHISDIKSKALEIANPDLLLAFKRDGNFYRWPGTVESEAVKDSFAYHYVAHLVLPPEL